MMVITRFPPSPTGFMHIGNARTALYNWLFARHHGGQFLVRIEDTDRARHSEDAVLAILNGLKWLNLEWDGEVVSQFERRDRHIAIARELVAKGHAYYCYCSADELEEMRRQAKEQGLPTFYDRRWRDRDPSDAPPDRKPVVRIKAPLTGESVVEDQVQGQVTVQNKTLDDFIILRSDETPTYMLSVVCDDHDMGVTHVLRGDDHLNNTFRQKIIYDAMGWDVPVFAHMPMILGADGSKLSKRHGAVNLEDFRARGYLPEAVENYLLRLGWSHGNDEIISREQATAWFSLENIVKSAAKFDYDKLESLNTHYMKQADDSRILALITPLLIARHAIDISADETAKTRLLAGMAELKGRAKTLLQLCDEGSFYAKKIPYSFDNKATEILRSDAIQVLDPVLHQIRDHGNVEKQAVEDICKRVAADSCDGKLGKVAMPVRAALTGTTVSPSIFDAAAILGFDEVIARLEYAIENFTEKSDRQNASAN